MRCGSRASVQLDDLIATPEERPSFLSADLREAISNENILFTFIH
jgi:hypothetical protein